MEYLVVITYKQSNPVWQVTDKTGKVYSEHKTMAAAVTARKVREIKDKKSQTAA